MIALIIPIFALIVLTRVTVWLGTYYELRRKTKQVNDAETMAKYRRFFNHKN